MRVRVCCYAFALAQPTFFSSERSSHKMMGKVALLGLAVACGLGGAAAQVSTADLCAHLCCSFGVGRGRGRRLDGAGRGRSGRLRHVATSQRNVTARPCVRAHQECAKCSADLNINGIVGVDDLPFLLSQVGRTACSVSEGAHHMEKMDERTHTGRVAALTTYGRANGGPLNTINIMCMSATTNADAVGDLCE